MGGPPGWGLGKVLTITQCKTYHVINIQQSLGPGLILGTTYALERDMKFGTWNVRSLHRSGSLTTAARELARYKLDLVGV